MVALHVTAGCRSHLLLMVPRHTALARATTSTKAALEKARPTPADHACWVTLKTHRQLLQDQLPRASVPAITLAWISLLAQHIRPVTADTALYDCYYQHNQSSITITAAYHTLSHPASIQRLPAKLQKHLQSHPVMRHPARPRRRRSTLLPAVAAPPQQHLLHLLTAAA